MYKVLIVDDEKNIRLGIQAMVKREFKDTFLTFLASDGEEALEVIQEVKIDVLITDIKMPKMDGITLIQHLQGEKTIPAVIILSGYDDFEFAREAIKCKVKDYLLKPVNRTELFQTLKKVVSEIEVKDDQADILFQEYLTSQLNYLLLNPNVSDDEIKRVCAKVNLKSSQDGYYVGVVKSTNQMKGEELRSYINRTLAVHDAFGEQRPICFCDKDGKVVIISNKEDIFSILNDQLCKEKHINFTLGISGKQDDLITIKEAYKEANIAGKYNFLFPRKLLIYYDEIKGNATNGEIPLESMKKIANMLGTDRDREMKSLLLDVLDYDTIAKYSIQYMERISDSLNTIILDEAFNKLGEESIEIFKLYNRVGYIYNYQNFNEYFYAIEELVMRLHEYMKQIRSVYSEQKYLEKAIEFIHENYYKDLNLAVVSNYISLNYSYFSHTFKEYTGMNFVDYLKKVRIEHAKKLLLESDYKVFEISSMVGYKNSKQFARVFREIVGISPKEYRIQTN
ncbi:response regulator [Bacillus timonensis]|nr:response regulator [Bacillus timonensis]